MPNVRPSDITLSNRYVRENAANGTVIATLGAVDPDGGVPTFTLLDNAGGRFVVVQNAGVWELRVANGTLLDAEVNGSHRIAVQVSDGAGGLRSENFVIQVRDLTDPIRFEGPEILVADAPYQVYDAGIATLTSGRAVLVWTDLRRATPTSDLDASIRARILNADGTFFSPTDFVINTSTAEFQNQPVVAALTGDRWAVAWTDNGLSQIRGRVMNGDGTALTAVDFAINVTDIGDQISPVIAALPDGRFVVVWEQESATAPDTSSGHIRARIMNPDGTASTAADFIVNTTTLNLQYQPSVAVLSDGRFVISWTDESNTAPDTSVSAIRARVFNADGTASTASDVLINTTTASTQHESHVTALANGRFVVVWSHANGSNYDIRGRIMNGDGTAVSGSDFLINAVAGSDQEDPHVAALPDGRFLVAWHDERATAPDTEGSHVRFRIMNADGTPSTTGDYIVNTGYPDNQTLPVISVLQDGRVMIAWTDLSYPATGGLNNGVRARILDLSAAPDIAITGGVVAENSAAGTVAATLSGAGLTYLLVDDAGGRFALNGTSIVVANPAGLDFENRPEHRLTLQVTDSLGVVRRESIVIAVEDVFDPIQRASAEFQVNTTTSGSQAQSAMTTLADGRIVVVWGDTEVRARILSPDGMTAIGNDFVVNTTTSRVQSEPDIATLSDGRFAVVWTDDSRVGTGVELSEIRARIFNANGTAASPADVIVNSVMGGIQNDAQVQALPGGGFMVVWISSASPETISARIINANGAPASPEDIVIANASRAITLEVERLADGRFVVLWQTNPVSGGNTLTGQIVNADGTLSGGLFAVGQLSFDLGEAAIAALPDGGFMVTYAAQNGLDIRGRAFGPDGQPTGAEYLVNTSVNDGQYAPEMIRLPDGRFVVVWTDQSRIEPDTYFQSVRARILNADGTGVGDDFVVNTTTNRGQLEPAIRLIDGGRFIVTWTDFAGDGSGTRIAAQIYDIAAPVAPGINGTPGIDTLVGTAAADVINGLGGDDALFGQAGSDTLNGGDGNDTLVGNADVFAQEGDILNGEDGDDLIYAEFTDTLNGGAGRDSLIAVNSFNFTLNMAATSIEYAVMDFGADVIDASGQTVRVDVFAGGGNDTVTGSNFDDLIFGSAGDDVIIGGQGADAIVGNDGIDSLSGGDGDDRVYFDAQDSFVSGGAGYDAGYVTPSTGAGVVINMGAASLEFIQDFAGAADTILASTMTVGLQAYVGGGADTVDGSAFADVVWGEAGDDALSGHDGADVLVGGAGLDRISGGAGNDSLYAGVADGVRDTFVFQHTGAANADAVYEFALGVDRIDLSAFGSSFAGVGIVASGGSSVVYLNGQLICTVVGVTGLTAADFIMSASPAPAEPDDGGKTPAPLVQPHDNAGRWISIEADRAGSYDVRGWSHGLEGWLTVLV